MTVAKRYHDISCGHRVSGHEGKCQHLHGHNYRVHFSVQSENDELDDVGRVLDFSVIKAKLCMWLEEQWDHKFLAWDQDILMLSMHRTLALYDKRHDSAGEMFNNSLVWVPFNPTAENMAIHLLKTVGPQELAGTGCVLVSVTIEETRKCSVEESL